MIILFPSFIHKLDIVYFLVYWTINYLTYVCVCVCQLFHIVIETIVLSQKESSTTSTWHAKSRHHNISTKPIIYNRLEQFIYYLFWSCEVLNMLYFKILNIVVKLGVYFYCSICALSKNILRPTHFEKKSL